MNANVDSLGDSVSCVKYIIGGMTFLCYYLCFLYILLGSSIYNIITKVCAFYFCTILFLFYAVVGAAFLTVDEVLGFHPFLACQL